MPVFHHRLAKKFASVSRRTLHRSRSLMFRFLKINGRRGHDLFEVLCFLIGHPDVAMYVKEVGMFQADWCQADEPWVSTLLRLPKVTRFGLYGCDISKMDVLSGSERLTSLYLDGCTADAGHLWDVVGSCASLTLFRLCGKTSLVKSLNGFTPRNRRFPSVLEELYIDFTVILIPLESLERWVSALASPRLRVLVMLSTLLRMSAARTILMATKRLEIFKCYIRSTFTIIPPITYAQLRTEYWALDDENEDGGKLSLSHCHVLRSLAVHFDYAHMPYVHDMLSTIPKPPREVGLSIIVTRDEALSPLWQLVALLVNKRNDSSDVQLILVAVLCNSEDLCLLERVHGEVSAPWTTLRAAKEVELYSCGPSLSIDWFMGYVCVIVSMSKRHIHQSVELVTSE